MNEGGCCIVKEGWLSKRGDKGLSIYLDYCWRRRYFKLTTAGSLEYYCDKEDAQARGVLYLDQAVGVVPSEVDPLYFKLVFPTREVILAADSSSGREEWCAELSDFMRNRCLLADQSEHGNQLYLAYKQRLDPFIQNYCSTLSLDEIILLINKGDKVLKEIAAQNEESVLIADHFSVIALMWRITVEVAKYDELFTSGVVRIDDPTGLLFCFLDSCAGVYPRYSSHFPERLGETWLANPGQQRGLDLKALHSYQLPAMKQTILFFRLGDGTTVIKMEKAGCPPFWRRQFMSLENLIEFSNHSKDYVQTRFVPNPGMKEKKTEHVPNSVKELFREAIDKVYPGIPFAVQETTPQENTINQEMSRHKSRIYKYGVYFGITAMVEVFDSLASSRLYNREETLVGSFCIWSDTTKCGSGEGKGDHKLTDKHKEDLNENAKPEDEPNEDAEEPDEVLQSSMLQSMLELSYRAEECGTEDEARVASVAKHYKDLFVSAYLEEDKKRGYKGERKGNEVCLPVLSSWFS